MKKHQLFVLSVLLAVVPCGCDDIRDLRRGPPATDQGPAPGNDASDQEPIDTSTLLPAEGRLAPTWIVYADPDCASCDRNSRMVDALDGTYRNLFRLDRRVAADHQAELRRLGIANHGVACVQGDKVLWKKVDHDLTPADLHAGVRAVVDQLK